MLSLIRFSIQTRNSERFFVVKIYTKTGDQGKTALYQGGRVEKNHIRITSYGEIDELNSHLGVAISTQLPPTIAEILTSLQHWLFDLGGEIANAKLDPTADHPTDEARIEQMEKWIDSFTAQLKPLKQFILPGGSPGASALHVARSVCRRAERTLIGLQQKDPEGPFREQWLMMVNRLSDLLFVLARACNQANDVEDVHWNPS